MGDDIDCLIIKGAPESGLIRSLFLTCSVRVSLIWKGSRVRIDGDLTGVKVSFGGPGERSGDESGVELVPSYSTVTGEAGAD